MERVVIVNNGSTDESGERIDEEFPDVEAQFNDGNLRFAAEMNAGVDRVTSGGADIKYRPRLNNDIVFPQDSILEDFYSELETASHPTIITLIGDSRKATPKYICTC